MWGETRIDGSRLGVLGAMPALAWRAVAVRGCGYTPRTRRQIAAGAIT